MEASSKKRSQRKTERQNRIVLGVIASVLILVLAGWFFFQSRQGGIALIAANPEESEEIAFVTFEKHIFLSKNGGQTWLQIANAGKGMEG